MTTLTVSEATVAICHGTADLIEKHGYHPTADIHEESGRLSVVGAMRLFVRPDYRFWCSPWVSNIPEYDQALHDLDRACGNQSVREWSKGHSKDEVVDLLRGVGA